MIVLSLHLHPFRLLKMPIYPLISADVCLGKIDKSSLSQETLMELLIENIAEKHKVCYDLDTSKYIEADGIQTNDRNEVTKISWVYCELGGSIQLEWLPETVKSAFLNSNEFVGTASLTHLPDGLLHLSLSKNKLSGTINVTNLPKGMVSLFLNNNLFEGEADFSKLPESLVSFWISYNRKLSGSITSQAGKTFQTVGTLVKII